MCEINQALDISLLLDLFLDSVVLSTHSKITVWHLRHTVKPEFAVNFIKQPTSKAAIQNVPKLKFCTDIHLR